MIDKAVPVSYNKATRNGGKKMPDSEAKKKWISDNTIIFSVKLMRRTEADIIEYLGKMAERGIGRGTVLKMAIREYMQNHPNE